MSIYDCDLDRTAANYVALSPVSFIERSAEVFGDLPAVVRGRRREVRFEEIPNTATGKIQKYLLRERVRSANAIE